MRSRIRAMLAVAACALLAASARAQGATADALRAWGLIGWWSTRCDLPPSPTNSHYGFVAGSDGRAYLERNFGNSNQNERSEIHSAERRADGTIALTISFTSFNQVRLNVYAKSQGRVRVMYNRGLKGDVSVENGILRHNGRPTPWSRRCR